ncbi:MAG: type II toxin-antitoxin system VapC family toxin [Bryobacteraceae bacterium]
MKVLLDTHTFLFAINPVERLPDRIKTLLLDPTVDRWVSTASVWEIATKIRIGKLDLPENPQFYTEHIQALGARVLPVELAHSFALFSMPLHHRDPFDRMLIAQAKAEDLTILTKDAAFAPYGVPLLW